ncbi:MAG: hypothetical protein GY909_14385 [Oligoflexia bacterium]|nr:hypothetical protein [Oligoflexia bacterium]
MSGNFQKKSSNIFLTLFIGLIVVSFMFTGYESMRGTPDTVAKVGSTPIKFREYQGEYNRQLSFYKRIMGGKDLNQAQIKQFRIKENVINALVERKILLGIGEDLDILPGSERVKKEIKNFDYFKTNGKFDIERYKGLLQANSITPKDFEDDIFNQEQGRISQQLLSQVSISNSYVKAIENFKAKKLTATSVQLDKDNLRTQISVSNKEIREFLAKDQNKARVQSLFNDRKLSLDVPATVTASHILVMTNDKGEAKAQEMIQKYAKEVNTKNFKSLANKYTEDPSGKGKGGALGTFQKGRMVPEFDKAVFEDMKVGSISGPIKTQFGFHLIYLEKRTKGKEAKFDDFKNKLAKELIQNEKTGDFEKLVAKAQDEIKARLKSGNLTKKSSLVKKYNLKIDEKHEINRFEGTKGSIGLDDPKVQGIFKSTSKGQVHIFEEGLKATYVLNVSGVNTNSEKSDTKNEMKLLRNGLGNKLSRSIISQTREGTKVRVYDNLIQ